MIQLVKGYAFPIHSLVEAMVGFVSLYDATPSATVIDEPISAMGGTSYSNILTGQAVSREGIFLSRREGLVGLGI